MTLRIYVLRRWRLLALLVALLAMPWLAWWHRESCTYAETGALRTLLDQLDVTEPGWRSASATTTDGGQAQLLEEAADRLPGGRFSKPLLVQLDKCDPAEPLPDGMGMAIRSELNKLTSALAAAHCLTAGPIIQPTTATQRPSAPNRYAEQVAQLLFLEVIALAADGRGEEALAAARAIVEVGRSVGMESLETRCHCADVAVLGIEQTLARSMPSAGALLETQQLLAAEASDLLPLLTATARGERVRQFETPAPACLTTLCSMPSGSSAERLGCWLWHDAGSTRQRRANLELMTILVRSLSQGPRGQVIFIDCCENHLLAGVHDKELAGPILALVNVARHVHRTRMALASAQVVLAVERYRVEKGNWPENVAVLVPSWLDNLPQDDFGLSAIQVRKLEDGLVAYSVGDDHSDDGGVIERPSLLLMPKSRRPYPGTDVGLQVWNIDRRGLGMARVERSR